MNYLPFKIEVLKNILNREIELNNYNMNHKIVRLSQILDEVIVEYQKEAIGKNSCQKKQNSLSF